MTVIHSVMQGHPLNCGCFCTGSPCDKQYVNGELSSRQQGERPTASLLRVHTYLKSRLGSRLCGEANERRCHRPIVKLTRAADGGSWSSECEGFKSLAKPEIHMKLELRSGAQSALRGPVASCQTGERRLLSRPSRREPHHLEVRQSIQLPPSPGHIYYVRSLSTRGRPELIKKSITRRAVWVEQPASQV